MALIKCIKCGQEISDKAQTCIHCGTPIVIDTKIICDECGNQVNKNDNVCQNCGNPLTQNKTDIFNQPQEEIKQQKIICNKCGNQVEENANVCNYCGHPINKIEQSKKESIESKIIITSKRDKTLKAFRNFYPKFFGIIVIITIIVVIWMENNCGPLSRGNATMSASILVFIPCLILFVICNTIYNNASKTNITLTNKELYGTIYKIGKVYSISFPLDKISSIITVKFLGIIDGIMIIPFYGPAQKIFFIDNGEEFKQTLSNQVLDK